jgi:Uma2 family endonuclease
VKTLPTTPNVPSDTLLTPLPANAVPSLDDLYRLTAQNKRMVVRGVDWSYYKRLSEVVGDSRIRLAFDGKDLEIMVTGPLHENVGEFAGEMVRSIAKELAIPFRPMAKTTWERPEVERAVEADDCFYFLPEKIAQAVAALKRKSNNVADYANPDLAIEIDISPSKIDRPGIYAALRVTEVWRFGTDNVTIDRLKEDGTYESVEASGFLPIRASEIVRWVIEEDTNDVSGWEQRLRASVRGELAARTAGPPPEA